MTKMTKNYYELKCDYIMEGYEKNGYPVTHRDWSKQHDMLYDLMCEAQEDPRIKTKTERDRTTRTIRRVMKNITNNYEEVLKEKKKGA